MDVLTLLDGPVDVTVGVAAKTLQTLLYGAQTQWAADTATSVGDIVVPTVDNHRSYVCIAATSDTKTHATTEPKWTTADQLGDEITDDVVTWRCQSKGMLQEQIRLLTLIPASSGQIYWADGTATTGSPPWPPLGMEVHVMRDKLGSLTFIAAGDVVVQVTQEGV